METAEMSRAKQAHQKNAEPERCDVARVPQSEIPDATNENVADDEVERAP
jgi:hypothetical protein